MDQGIPNYPARVLPAYTPFRRIAATSRHHAKIGVYDSAIGYGAPRAYWGFGSAPTSASSAASITTVSPPSPGSASTSSPSASSSSSPPPSFNTPSSSSSSARASGTASASAACGSASPSAAASSDRVLYQDPFFRESNYVPDAVFAFEPLVGGFLEFACGGRRDLLADGEEEAGSEKVWLRKDEVDGERGVVLRETIKRLFGWVESGACFREVEELVSAEDERRVWLHRTVKGLKDKIWAGIPPMSVQRWDRRQLSSIEYEYEAVELLNKTLAVFEYLNDARVQQVMRVLHNRITVELARFGGEANEKRAQNQEAEVSLLELWDEYTKAFFNDVANRAHAWMVDRINAIRSTQKDAFDSMKAQEAHPHAENTKLISRLSLLVDLERETDCHLRISRYGFTRAASSTKKSSPAPSLEKFDEERRKMLEFAEKAHALFADGITKVRHAMGVGPFPVQFEWYMIVNDNADANKAVRGKDPKKRQIMFGPPLQEQKPEPWVQQLAERLQNGATDGFGFVVYRWKEYEGVPWEKLEAAITGDLMNWGETLVGGDAIKPRAKLQWIEMAGTGMESYRTHFQALRDSNQLCPGIRTDIFLVIDPRAANAWFPSHPTAEAASTYAERNPFRGHVGVTTMSSTTSTALGAMATDFEPWVLAVDADFRGPAPTSAAAAATITTTYPGWLRIQSSLVFEELYAQAASGVLSMGELWKSAASHPCAVCTGAVTEVEARRFAEWTGLRGRALKWLLDRPDALFYYGTRR